MTGQPGIGKTTAIRRIVELIGTDRAGGFYSAEIREGGQRVGFGLTTLDGKRGTLAHIDCTQGPRVGRYGVNVRDIMNVAVPAMRSARESGKIVIVDEIARMELFSSEFEKEVVRCLDSRCVIGTIQQRSDPVLNGIRHRDDVRVIVIDVSNRNSIPELVMSMI
ncbi:MAG: nucleoside-triphosphatase [Candidatus Thorarchaeota archaeon]